jgi:hypothetical protein
VGLGVEEGQTLGRLGEDLVVDIHFPFGQGQLVLSGFGDLAALGAPQAGDDLVAEALFDGVGGLQVVEEGGAEGVEFRGVLGGDEEVTAGQAVPEGIAAGAAFAFGGDPTAWALSRARALCGRRLERLVGRPYACFNSSSTVKPMSFAIWRSKIGEMSLPGHGNRRASAIGVPKLFV